MRYISSIILFFITPVIFAYPIIQNLSSNDIIFVQLQQLIASNAASLFLFEYTLEKNESIESIVATLGINKETLISLNRLPAPLQFLDSNTSPRLLIPNKSGIFLSTKPAFDIEQMLYVLYDTAPKNTSPLLIRASYHNRNHYFYFLENKTWHEDVEKRWKIGKYRFPTLNGIISSNFGDRLSPIGDNVVFHKGIDISSKEGTLIFSAQNGIIKQKGYSKIFGYFIEIEHKASSILYGHILESKHSIGDAVQIGEHIATMGSTGLSTGVHAHVELSIKKVLVNPLDYFVGYKEINTFNLR